MNTWLIVGLIALVLGIIAGNILLLKYSAKMPFKTSKSLSPEKDENPDDK